MALLPALKRGLQIAGRIDQKYNINKIFIQKYVPPGYRKTANKLVDITGTIGGGYGIVRFIESLYAPDTPGMSGQIPFKPKASTYQQDKARLRRTGRSGSRKRRKCIPANYSRRSSYYKSSTSRNR